jgi:hypothetical protein
MIMKTLAMTYFQFRKEQQESSTPDFHGTRDFYSLVKEVSKELNNLKSFDMKITEEERIKIIARSLERNFGGLPYSAMKIKMIFTEKYPNKNEVVFNILRKKTQILELIKENLLDESARYLMIITRGGNAAFILDSYLSEFIGNRIFMTGSKFEGDKDRKDYNFRVLSNIIQCMEGGSQLTMQNLEQVYGSLYELFN